MRLLVVNCNHAGETCGLDGSALVGSKCARCTLRDAREAKPEPIWFVEGVPRVPQPVPRDQWPMLARVVARLATKDDRGVGDTIARNLGSFGEWWKSAFHSLTGKSCGCTDRQAYLNARYPYIA